MCANCILMDGVLFFRNTVISFSYNKIKKKKKKKKEFEFEKTTF